MALAPLKGGSSYALNFLQELAGSESGENRMRYRSKTFDSLLADAAQKNDAKQVAQGCLQAENHLLQNGVAYPLLAQTSRLLLAPGVSGLMVSPAGDQICFVRAVVLD
jgi:ABC-type oligopeptide transport system substrate-binding subunit